MAASVRRVGELMKAIITAMFSAFILTSCASVSGPKATSADSSLLTGKWSGEYECLQGKTGLTLNLVGHSSGLVEGTFLFYPGPNASDAATGQYIVRGTYNSDKMLTLGPGAWIERPDGYIAVGLVGTIEADYNTINGTVTHWYCKSFHVNRM